MLVAKVAYRLRIAKVAILAIIYIAKVAILYIAKVASLGAKGLILYTICILATSSYVDVKPNCLNLIRMK